MSVSDPIGDMLTRIRNAQMRKKTVVATPASVLRGRVLTSSSPRASSAVTAKPSLITGRRVQYRA